MNNRQSHNLEKPLAAKIKKKLEDVQKISWVDSRLFDRSLEILSSCRRTLMNTYAFAFYLKKNNQKDIFEVNWTEMSKLKYKLFLRRIRETSPLPLKSWVDSLRGRSPLTLIWLRLYPSSRTSSGEEIKRIFFWVIDVWCWRYCERRRKALIDHVREGYENNLWEFYEENQRTDLKISLD